MWSATWLWFTPLPTRFLKKAKWIRIRNVTIGCVWLLCLTGPALTLFESPALTVIFICAVAFELIVISFCSISVLCVLIRPGPGEWGGGRQLVHQSKLRGFYTVMAILGVLLFRFGVNVITTTVYAFPQLGEFEKCVVWLSAFCAGLPSSLVLPLLFLQRAGQLMC